ncbi:hypothetical protein TVAG_463580 [Trichomonas vaginalis G3]|uniref:Uncharacterized protein n=1 Tax=Trichomonas vaginalis (strain ATCC PRA-98 / G3) TaxID=412133 RepID=A2EH30_TRIV3|nr:spectrin binding [Trichomonas vaginalis G3]EAY08078.1 hypothetical protein TVAG_463580 [Trichomonas vaginalis G3]KAI5543005.1 spectrin binding [Trichomonas vaginalis G3]|eukprot:XP_001320301.1 hypothetical protein [Trichomonas vaginalis G3]
MYAKEIEDLLLIQKDFRTLSIDTIDQVCDDILSTIFPSTPHGVYTITQEIRKVVRKHPKKVECFAKLISNLYEQRDETNFLGNFPDLFVDLNSDCTLYRLVRKLVQNNVMSVEKITQILQSISSAENSIFSFIFFADFAKKALVERYEPYRDRILQASTTFYMISDIAKNWAKYEANNFKLLEPIYEIGWFPNTVQYHIILDDVKFLENYSQSSRFNPMMKIELDQLYSNRFSTHFCEECTLPEFAGFWGSVNCFKFLLKCGATITPDMMSLIFSGGSLEIIKICYEMKINFGKGFQRMINFYYNDIYDWYIKEFETGCNFRNYAFTVAAVTNNLELVVRLMESNVDLSKEELPKNIVQCDSLELVKLFESKGVIFKRVDCVEAAASIGNEDILKYLIDIGSPVNPPPEIKNAEYPLISAINRQFYGCVKILLEAGAGPNTVTDSMTALSHACNRKSTDIVRVLCEYGAYVNFSASGKYNDRPIILSCIKGNIEHVKTLIEWGAEYDVTAITENINNKITVTQLNPLCAACQVGATDLLQYLINIGCDPNENDALPLVLAGNYNRPRAYNLLTELLQTGSKTLFDMLIVAIRQKNLENVKTLVSKGVSLANRDDGNRTPLHLAANHSAEILEYLLHVNNGSGINARDSEDKAPIHHALEAKNVDSVRLLLNAGANIDMLTNKGYSCLRIACQNLDFESAELLLDKRNDPNVEDFEGSTPLIAVCRLPRTKERLRMMEMLIAAGADCRMADSLNHTALHTLVLHDPTLSELDILTRSMKNINSFSRRGIPMMGDAVRLDTVFFEFLLLNGGDPWVTSNKGETLLHIAVETNHTRNAELLLSAGLSPKKKNRWLRSPMFNAFKGSMNEPINILRSLTMIDLLIAKGGNVNETDSRNSTPAIALFERRGHIPVEYIKILKEKYKVNMDKVNYEGKTVLLLADQHGLQDIVDYLDPEENHPKLAHDKKQFQNYRRRNKDIQ